MDQGLLLWFATLPSPGRATDFQQAQAKIGALAKVCATASGS